MGIEGLAKHTVAPVVKAAEREASEVLARELGAGLSKAVATLDKAAVSELSRSATKEIAAFNAAILAKAPELLGLKYQRMAENPFSFFRGSAHLFFQDLERMEGEALNDGARTLLQGDMHVNNFGTVVRKSGKIVVAPNDFDEAFVGPAKLDLKRFATSIVLAGQEAGLAPRETRKLVEHFAETYHGTLKALKQHELEIKDLPKPKLIKDLLEKAEETNVEKWLDKMAPEDNGKRLFVRSETSRSVSGQVKRDLEKAFGQFKESASDEARQELASYALSDAVTAVGGTGSVGRARYRLLLESAKGEAPIVLEFKEEVAAAMAPYLKGQNPFSTEAERYLKASRRMIGKLDPLMGEATLPLRSALQSESFLVRRVSPFKEAIDATTLENAEAFADLVKYYSGELAIGHAAGHELGLAGAADLLAGLGSGKDFARDAVDFGHRYAQQVSRDFRSFQSALAKDPLLQQA